MTPLNLSDQIVGRSALAVVWLCIIPASPRDASAQDGACCLGDGTCVETNAAGCDLGNGEFLGPGTLCTGAVCTGACCMPDGTCTEGSADACVSGTFQGAGSTCEMHCAGTLGSAFTWQGQLKDSGGPVNGSIDLAVSLWTSSLGSAQVGSTLLLSQVNVMDGLFAVQLDFGTDVFSGDKRFLEIAVRSPHDPTDTAPFTPLAPRQPITAAPYALQTPAIVANDEGTNIRVNNVTVLRLLPAFTVNDFRPSIVAGHANNSVGSAQSATISGGGRSVQPNSAIANFSTVGGGAGNMASGGQSTVGGGQNNMASGSNSAIAGGFLNTASSLDSTVGGGRDNTASGLRSTVPGGLDNTAEGEGSFAAGTQANALHNGAFVWGDSTLADVASSAADQFTARASGGARFFTDAALTTGVQIAAGGGSWSSVSDRNVKEHVAPVDARTLLDRLAAMPVTTWNYKSQDDSIRHIGPMAQDFHAAFGVGENDTHITSGDADGVSLAAIQGLYQDVKKKHVKFESLLAKKDTEIAAQKARIDELTIRLEIVEKLLAGAHPYNEPTK